LGKLTFILSSHSLDVFPDLSIFIVMTNLVIANGK